MVAVVGGGWCRYRDLSCGEFRDVSPRASPAVLARTTPRYGERQGKCMNLPDCRPVCSDRTFLCLWRLGDSHSIRRCFAGVDTFVTWGRRKKKYPHTSPPQPPPKRKKNSHIVNSTSKTETHQSKPGEKNIQNSKALIAIMAQFQLSSLIAALPEAENGAWGPPSNVGSSLNEVPYAPYSKGDKLGRMADWTNENAKDGGNQRGRGGGYNRNYRGGDI